MTTCEELLAHNWFPKSIFRDGKNVRDWCGHTVQLQAPSSSSDYFKGNYPY